METEENGNRNMNYSYGSFDSNVCNSSPIHKNNETKNNISNETNDRISEASNFVTNGSNSTPSRLSLPFCNNRCNQYKAPEDAISNEESVYTVRSDSAKSDKYDANKSCWWSHPQVRSNWRVFLAALALLVVGIGLIAIAIFIIIFPAIGFQSYVFFIAGIICFIPGAYHVVYVYFAVKGRRGYEFHQLPLFN